MDGGDVRDAIKFCLKAGLCARETLVFVQKAYGKEIVNVFRYILDLRRKGVGRR
jgi:hypothetical protein